MRGSVEKGARRDKYWHTEGQYLAPLRPSRERRTSNGDESTHLSRISGFFDIQATSRRNDPNVVSLGYFEVDLSRDFGKNTQVAAAVAENADGTTLTGAHRRLRRLPSLRRSDRTARPTTGGEGLPPVGVGRFDVPFGNDWQYFASKDRTELSAPLTTGAIMDGGYNDTGLRILGNSRSFNPEPDPGDRPQDEGEQDISTSRLATITGDLPQLIDRRARLDRAETPTSANTRYATYGTFGDATAILGDSYADKRFVSPG